MQYVKPYIVRSYDVSRRGARPKSLYSKGLCNAISLSNYCTKILFKIVGNCVDL